MNFTEFTFICEKVVETPKGFEAHFQAAHPPVYEPTDPVAYQWFCDELERDVLEDLPEPTGSLVLPLSVFAAKNIQVGKHYALSITPYKRPNPQLEPEDFDGDELNRYFGGQEVHWSRDELKRELIAARMIPDTGRHGA